MKVFNMSVNVVCAIKRDTNTVHNTTIIDATVPIAGEFIHGEGGSLDPKWTRLKSSASNADRQKEGLRLEIHGGKFGGENQKAIVEFLCPAKSGNDIRNRNDIWTNDDDDDKDEEEDHSGEATDDRHDGTLKLISWAVEGGVKVLRLHWTTKYACEDASSLEQASSSNHWGFFTWFIIMYATRLLYHLDSVTDLPAVVCSSVSQPISYLAPGSTIIAMEQGELTLCLTVIPYVIFLICSGIG